LAEPWVKMLIKCCAVSYQWYTEIRLEHKRAPCNKFVSHF
jgi:hypothetical protein